MNPMTTSVGAPGEFSILLASSMELFIYSIIVFGGPTKKKPDWHAPE